MTELISSRADLDNRVVTLAREGVSIRALTRRFKVGRNTIRRILARHSAQREGGHTVTPANKTPRPSKLESLIPKIKKILGEYEDITGQRLFEKLTEEDGYRGGVSILREKLRELRPAPKVAPVIRFETDPGEQGQMDWSPYTIAFRRSGKMDVLCFSYVLGFSRRQYLDFTDNRRFPTMIRRHQDAFTHFGGVPRSCLYDGEKTVILRWEAGKAVFNPKFLVFITHYECRPVACGPRRPETKGKVERPFDYIEKNFFNGRTFEDLEDLRQAARWWLAEKSDTHLHRTTGRPPIELFLESEQMALRPLPAHPYDTAEVHYLLVDREGFVTFETNRYSVPAAYVLDVLPVKASEREITIYNPTIECIARHERFAAGAKSKSEAPEHELKKRERHGMSSVRERFLALGEGAEDFLRGLEGKHTRTAGMYARLILGARERYHADDIAEALRHATRYHAFDAATIERILRAKATPRTLESMRNEAATERLRAMLPKVEQRPLSLYQDLLEPRDVYEAKGDDQPDGRDQALSEGAAPQSDGGDRR